MITVNTEIEELSKFDFDILKKKFPDNIYVMSPLFHKWAFNDGVSEPIVKSSFIKNRDRMVIAIARSLPIYKVQIKVGGFDSLDLYYYIFGDNRFGIDRLIFRLAERISKESQVLIGRIPVIENDNFFNDSLSFFIENLFKIHSGYLTNISPDLTEYNFIHSITELKDIPIKSEQFRHIPNEIFIQEQEHYKNTFNGPHGMFRGSFPQNELFADLDLYKSYRETMDKREKNIPSEPITISAEPITITPK